VSPLTQGLRYRAACDNYADVLLRHYSLTHLLTAESFVQRQLSLVIRHKVMAAAFVTFHWSFHLLSTVSLWTVKV